MICIAQNKKKQKDRQSIVQLTLKSKEFIKLNSVQLKLFIEQLQIIHCIHAMQTLIQYEKLTKLYFLLLQVCTVYSQNDTIYNFLIQFEFAKKIKDSRNNNKNSSQNIMMTKICSFLDSFKVGRSAIIQINSLISQYLQYRFLQKNTTFFVSESCGIIQAFVNFHFQQSLKQVRVNQQEQGQKFNKNYQVYSELCTIYKRASLIRCSLISLKQVQIPTQIRIKMQQKYNKQNQSQNIPSEQPKQQKQQKPLPQNPPKLNIRRKLTAINSIINSMEHNI